MRRSLRSRFAVAFIACSLLLGTTAAVAEVSSTELKCAKALGKGAAKVAKTVARELSSCRAADISGKATGSCPNATNSTKIATATGSLTASAQKSCKSVCALSSSVECIADALCPVKVTASSGVNERCTAAGKAYFDMGSLGFPGAFCEAKLGHEMTMPADIGDCSGDVAQDAASALVGAIYGSITNGSGISSNAQGCLAAISKGAQKLSSGIVKGVAKCRNSILGGASGDPAVCQTSDTKLVAKIAKLEAKLDASMDTKCTNDDVLVLDLCGNGVGQTMTVADAKTCIKAAVREISDSNAAPVLRQYGDTSIIDAGYPPPARCGDDVINQLPNAQLLLGEECDGADDAACPGACAPPGDAFECTCKDRPRMRLFASHADTDADAGWTGISHQQGVADLSGYITELSGCDCDAFDGPTCIGSAGNPICNVTGFQKPSCSWEPFSGTRCDDRGNHNGIDADGSGNHDCWICDEWSANSGTFCKDERDCDAQCYTSAGTATGPCDSQADCGASEVCRGQCDRNQSCVIIPNGAPLPVAAAGATVCAVQRFRTDVVGTRNVITGEHEFDYRLFSIIHLGEQSTRPCPVCGGFCVGGANDLEICQGRCSTTTSTSCRFDTDCPGGETCSKTSPECPGGFCQLDLVCGAIPSNPTAGKTCHVEYTHPVFGTMSNDCLPPFNSNITGQGFQIDYLPSTTDTITLPAVYPCTAAGFDNYLCPCPGVGGEPTKPNSCAPACDAAGPDFGVGCGTGNNNSGQGSICVLGSKAGKLCRSGADCPGGTCTNPTHCVGDLALEHVPCSNNGDCGSGTCQDACPGGACVPLCVPTLTDSFEGICAAGPPITHCDNPRFNYISCALSAAQSGTCSATCSVSATPCDSKADCPSGETCNGPCSKAQDCEAGENGVLGDSDDNEGAGNCNLGDRSCYLDPLIADGGSTVDGEGDPEHDYASGLFCYTATLSPGVNATSGFPGPGRVRQHGTNITNGFPSIPVP